VIFRKAQHLTEIKQFFVDPASQLAVAIRAALSRRLILFRNGSLCDFATVLEL
jgi:hypothetical protein